MTTHEAVDSFLLAAFGLNEDLPAGMWTVTWEAPDGASEVTVAYHVLPAPEEGSK